MVEQSISRAKPVFEERTADNYTERTVAPGSEDVDLTKRTLADDILDNAFKMKLDEWYYLFFTWCCCWILLWNAGRDR